MFIVHPVKETDSLKMFFPGMRWMYKVLKNVLPQQLDMENANKKLHPIEN